MKHAGTDVILKNGSLSSRKKGLCFPLATRSFASCIFNGYLPALAGGLD